MILSRFLPVILSVLILSSKNNAQNWSPVTGKIMTEWAVKVNPDKPLPHYPRPQMVRGNWQNWNGLWQYSIQPASRQNLPGVFNGNILVPYAIESALSGVGKGVGKDSVLWYKKSLNMAKPGGGQQVLLHFGAVDWRCDVYINGTKAGSHAGGFDPFYINITKYLKKGNKQDIMICVWDPTDDGPQPRGKQVNKPEGIWYTPVTGIWQTVWTEIVPATYITATRQIPDVDGSSIQLKADVAGAISGDKVLFEAFDGNNKVGQITIKPGAEDAMKINHPKLWSPAKPHLYHLKMTLLRNGKAIDGVQSYFAMRKISLLKDRQGITRMALNNEFLFQYGPLDQGWWPDGLYTAPTDDALMFDIIKTKEMGFNMIRKHIKLEPARWYYYCDSIGLLVWQDMPSGDLGSIKWDMRPGQISAHNRERSRSATSESYYKKEWKAIMDAAYKFPCIVMWVPFNEAWGQFKTREITEWTMAYDPSRLVNSASGGNYFYTGHVLDIHNYPDPNMPDPNVYGKLPQALALGEFGGLGLPVEGHTWQNKNNWGYQSFKSKEELLKKYTEQMRDLKTLVSMGLSAAVYTQTTDVEIETNGLLTYDRKVVKMPEADLHKLHQPLYEPVD